MSRHARKRRARRHRGTLRRVFLAVLGVSVIAIAAAAAGAAVYVVHQVNKAPPLNKLHAVVPGPNSRIYAAGGVLLGYIKSDVLRAPVTWAQIPADLRNATVAIEDQRYWQHGGVDLKGILRSAFQDALNGQALQGGSDIEMQLVRNLYLPVDERTERTLSRKIVEVVEAERLEKAYSKQYLLTRYLNSVPYGTVGGQNAIGVAAAAQIFFDKPLDELDLAQCALLAGLPQAPSEYNPFLDPGSATQRRNQVLAKMAQLGYVTQAQARAAENAPLEVDHNDFYDRRKENFWFDFITQELIDRYGPNVVEQGGLKVYTTLNLHDQQLARAAMKKELGLPTDPASAVVTENVHNGDVLAMAQSVPYSENEFNLAANGQRQPGSTFKAIVLADALTRGIDPFTTTFLSHTLPAGWLPGYPTYSVTTFEGTSLNVEENLVTATVTSDNTVFAQLAAELGEKTVTAMAYRMGVVTHLYSNPAEALGGLKYGVSPLEMANVYATLADGGYRNKQISILKVVFPNGRVDSSWGKPSHVKVLSNAVTSVETQILEDNVHYGTATHSAIQCPTAAKTGTTSSLYDAWLDGYTPDLATAVWIGYPGHDVSMTDVHGEPQQGGYIPAFIWHDYMSEVVGNHCVNFGGATEPPEYEQNSLTGPEGLQAPTTTGPLTPPTGTTSPGGAAPNGEEPNGEEPNGQQTPNGEQNTGEPQNPGEQSPGGGGGQSVGGANPNIPPRPTVPVTTTTTTAAPPSSGTLPGGGAAPPPVTSTSVTATTTTAPPVTTSVPPPVTTTPPPATTETTTAPAAPTAPAEGGGAPAPTTTGPPG